MFRWTLVMALACAQPLPDSAYFVVPPGGDTTFLVVWKVAPFGWEATLYLHAGLTWQTRTRDSAFLESKQRLLRFVRYENQASFPDTLWVPRLRCDCTYPLPGLVVCTGYEQRPSLGTFLPTWRSTLYGTAQRWDSLLSGWVGKLLFRREGYPADSTWPFPVLSHRRLWGDSLLFELYDSTYQVFLEAGGYFQAPTGSGCDSLVAYQPPRLAGQPIGFYRLCPALGGALQTQADSFYSSPPSQVRSRWLTYDASNRLLRDSVEERRYPGPVFLRYAARYEYEPSGRLSQVHLPDGTYLLAWGTQVVFLPTETHPTLFWNGREGKLPPELSNYLFSVYDTLGRLVKEGHLSPEGYFRLEEQAPGLYLLRVGLYTWRLLVQP